MPPTTSPADELLTAAASAPLPGTWTGTLAFINQPSSDGRYLRLADPADLATRQLPMPLLYQADLAPGHDGGTQGLGVITRAWVEGNRLMGQGCFDMQDPDAAELARKTADGFVGAVSVDLEPNFSATEDFYDVLTGRLLSSLSEQEIRELGLDINPVNYEGPDAVGQDDRDAQEDDTIPIPQQSRYSMPVVVFDGWKLMSATMVSQPAFADARIKMDVPVPAFAAEAVGSATVLPLANGRAGQGCTECGGQKSLDKPRSKARKLAKAGTAAKNADGQLPPEHGDGCECSASGSCGCTELACSCGQGTCTCPAAQSARAAVTAAAQLHTQVHEQMAAFRSSGVFGTPPVAEGNPAWDNDAAAARVAQWASSDGSGDKDKINWQKYGQAFLWKDTSDGPADNIGDYKFGYCDVIGGKLQVIPKAVFQAAARIDQADVPDADRETVKTRIRALYGAIGKKRGQKLQPPFDVQDGQVLGIRVHDAGQQRGPVSVQQISKNDDDARDQLAGPDPSRPDGTQLAQTPVAGPLDQDEKGKPMPQNPVTNLPSIKVGGKQLTAASAPIAPPGGWFEDPALPCVTPIVVTREGRVMGHLADWKTCHTGMPNRCTRPPRSKTGYALFHVGALLTREGDELAVGTIVLGTDHASVADSVSAQAAMAHYADTGYAVAVVRAGEDEHGIWVAGALVADASKEQVAALRRSPLSGDWRMIGGNLELVAALAVNTPGFPVPRAQSRMEHARVAALTAAGVVAPAVASASPCDGGVQIDMDALAAAVVERAERIAADRAALADRAGQMRARVQAARDAARLSRQSAARRVASRAAVGMR